MDNEEVKGNGRVGREIEPLEMEKIDQSAGQGGGKRWSSCVTHPSVEEVGIGNCFRMRQQQIHSNFKGPCNRLFILLGNDSTFFYSRVYCTLVLFSKFQPKPSMLPTYDFDSTFSANPAIFYRTFLLVIYTPTLCFVKKQCGLKQFGRIFRRGSPPLQSDTQRFSDSGPGQTARITSGPPRKLLFPD